MTLLVPVGLVLLWAAVLLPPFLRSRSESRLDPVASFGSRLALLDRSGSPRPAMGHSLAPVRGRGSRTAAPMTLREARQRRRDVISILLVAAAVTLLAGAAVAPLRFLLGVHLLVDVALAGYVALLAQAQRDAAERRMKVRFLPGVAGGGAAGADEGRAPAAAAGEPLLLLRTGG